MKPYRTHLLVCAGTGCVSNRSFKIKQALENEIKKKGLEEEVLVVSTGCNGFCAQGPIMVVQPDGIFYQQLKEENIPFLVEEHLLKGRPVKDFMYVPPKGEEPVPKMMDIGFFKHQTLIVLRNRGQIDPENIDEYIANDGYSALARALTSMTPEEIIAEVKKSGLRGRGGAGFPTGNKWEFCRLAPGDEKFVICNADEGDPGAFMDRSVLEADPHSVLEGMTIGAYAIGANQGFVYVRNEYPLAVKRLNIAIEQAREYGLLGRNIFDSGFNFSVQVIRGGGAFVCGEETALLMSIEGKMGEPRPRPPFPAQKGLWDRPTVINNVETWANVPMIINRGADWYAQIGTGQSKGTKVFSLVGKVNNTGLIEVPMGITLRQIIYDIGGGIAAGKRFKAVQTGGPSGGCIPENLLDLPVDYEKLTGVGSIMGSGGLIVMDEETCMVDVARYFLEFLKEESCGKCVACREGIERLLQTLTDICDGKGKMEDIELLEELGSVVKDFALCGLGQTAPNPVLSTIKYFRDEYVQHIKYKRCPAMVCENIISSPCKYSCPVGTDVPAFITLAARGQFKMGYDVIRHVNPFPMTTAYVCHHPCEDRCRAGDGGDRISVKAIKRYIADQALSKGLKPVTPSKKRKLEKVAIVGSGPAGLTAAHDLAREGYDVTVFEKFPVPGGMVATGIPDYRLPKHIYNLEIKAIQDTGVTVKTNSQVTNLGDLFGAGYKAIFLAVGAHKSLKLGIPGEDTRGVLDPIEFLRTINFGGKVKVGRRVAIIGGGNAAIDAARTALRLDSEEVFIVYRRTRAEMPAMKAEIEAALDEGVDIQFLTSPVRIISENGHLIGVECIRNELGDFDKSGRRRPVPIEGSNFVIELDTLVPAISQEPDLSFLNGELETTKWNTIVVDPETLATKREGVFAGGDAVTGPKTIADAISHGKIAAMSIHQYLRGEPVQRVYEVIKPSFYVEPVEAGEMELSEMRRPEMPRLPVAQRINCFDVVELGLTDDMVFKETRRCLRCDLRGKS